MRRLTEGKSLVLFSGGQDSSILLAWALSRYAHVETIGFNYGQRHSVELEARKHVRAAIADAFPEWALRLGPDLLTDLTGFGALSETALTRATEIAMGEDGLPTTFVPGRNLVFLTTAAGYAYRRDLKAIVAGMCEADYSGYPDCRAPALRAQEEALRLGLDADFTLETPLMSVSKAASWRLAEEIGGATLVEIIRRHSHTCYIGARDAHDWGGGCGACPACELRARGWREYQAGA